MRHRFYARILKRSARPLLAGFALASCTALPGDDPGAGNAMFERDIKPLLELNCLQCHNSRISHGHLVLESRESTFRTRPGGPVIVPGKPEESLVYSVIRFPDELANAMPPTRHRLETKQIKALRRWIAAGAPWPAGDEGRLQAPAEEYPYPPVKHPALRQ